MILSNPVGWVRDGDTDNNIKDRMKALRIFCLGGLLLLYAQAGMGQDSIRTEHLQEVKVNARQHRILTLSLIHI